MDQINQYLIKNTHLSFFKYTEYSSIYINNSVFYTKLKVFKSLFFYKILNSKKINLNKPSILNKSSINIVYF